MKENHIFTKLEEDDILEILLEHFQDQGFEFGKGILLGNPGLDLRFVGAIGSHSDKSVVDCDLTNLDKTIEFNGFHSYLRKISDSDIGSAR